MMSFEELVSAEIPLSSDDASEVLKANAAIEWLVANTTLEVDSANPTSVKEMPASAKLFVGKYVEIMSYNTGVSSQSIEGLSLSFNSADKSTMLWQLAQSLLGGYLRQARVYPAKRRW